MATKSKRGGECEGKGSASWDVLKNDRVGWGKKGNSTFSTSHDGKCGEEACEKETRLISKE